MKDMCWGSLPSKFTCSAEAPLAIYKFIFYITLCFGKY